MLNGCLMEPFDFERRAQRISTAKSCEALWSILDQICWELGYVAWTFADITGYSGQGRPPGYRTTLSDAFVTAYFDQGWPARDPVLRMALGQSVPFHWHDLDAWQRARQRGAGKVTDPMAVFRFAFGHDLGDAFVLPKPMLDRAGSVRFALFCAYGDTSGPLDPTRAVPFQTAVALIGTRLLELYPWATAANRRDPGLLTDRETEILWHAAQGRDAPTTAMILHVKTATVYKHRERIREKLGAETTQAAVYFAIRNGLLDL